MPAKKTVARKKTKASTPPCSATFDGTTLRGLPLDCPRLAFDADRSALGLLAEATRRVVDKGTDADGADAGVVLGALWLALVRIQDGSASDAEHDVLRSLVAIALPYFEATRKHGELQWWPGLKVRKPRGTRDATATAAARAHMAGMLEQAARPLRMSGETEPSHRAMALVLASLVRRAGIVSYSQQDELQRALEAKLPKVRPNAEDRVTAALQCAGLTTVQARNLLRPVVGRVQ